MSNYEKLLNVKDQNVESPGENTEVEGSPLVKESILLTIKKMLGLLPDQEEFDTDLIVLINSAIGILTQVGVGPKTGFRIKSKEELWGDFVNEGDFLDMVEPYIFLRVKIVFDPSQLSGAVLQAYKDEIKELEWRINVKVEQREEVKESEHGLSNHYST